MTAMKLSVLMPLAALLLGCSTSALLSARNNVDQCAHVDQDLVTSHGGHNTNSGHIDQCLCLSQLPSFIQSDPVARSASQSQGQSEVLSALSTLITSSSSHKTCSYPVHAVSACSKSDPCDFSCKDGYSYSAFPKSCVCEHPKKECNGVCGEFKACSSKRSAAGELEGLLAREPEIFKRHEHPHPSGWYDYKREAKSEPEPDPQSQSEPKPDGVVRRDLNLESKRDPEPAPQPHEPHPSGHTYVKRAELAKAKVEKREVQARGWRLGKSLGCPRNWEACGVFGGSRHAWECVDTMNDLESCGGCTIPLTHTSSPIAFQDLMTFGTDCTALPGVSDVECIRGACAVRACARGWVLGRSGDRCMRVRRGGKLHLDEDWEEEETAAEWGLEHVPLE